ncbi:MAG TPA: hypothetical protein VM571_01030 [Noviherbaspirillum sp.]|nr:hypothetical protein [Noviherbaspirillum sp.]
MSAPIGGPGHVTNTPTNGGVDAGFKESLKGKSTDELIGMLGNSSYSPEQIREIGNALLEKMKETSGTEGAGGANGAGGVEGLSEDEEDKLKKLLEKLKSGTITESEMKELQGLMQASGMPPEAINKTFEAYGKKAPEDNNEV